VFATETLREETCYRWGSLTGAKPVLVWVGRIDSSIDLKMQSPEPVVSCIVRSMREGMPTLNLVPVVLSAMLSDPFERIPPFDVSDVNFEPSYRAWKRSFIAGEAEAWTMGPADVYAQAMRDLLASRVKRNFRNGGRDDL
jgi:hypothetical protein